MSRMSLEHSRIICNFYEKSKDKISFLLSWYYQKIAKIRENSCEWKN